MSLEFKTLSQSIPEPGKVIIADIKGSRKQVTVGKDGKVYEWIGYDESATACGTVADIEQWRGCSGFDF